MKAAWMKGIFKGIGLVKLPTRIENRDRDLTHFGNRASSLRSVRLHRSQPPPAYEIPLVSAAPDPSTTRPFTADSTAPICRIAYALSTPIIVLHTQLSACYCLQLCTLVVLKNRHHRRID